MEHANPIKCCIQESSKVRTSLELSAKECEDGRRTKLEFANEMGHLTRPRRRRSLFTSTAFKADIN